MKKTFKPTLKMLAAARRVFVCMAAVDTIRPIVEAYQRENMDAVGFQRFKLCESYLMPEHAFLVFDGLNKESRILAGLHVVNDDHCPLLVAKEQLRQASRELLDSMKPLTGLGSADFGYKNHEQAVELTLCLLAPFVR